MESKIILLMESQRGTSLFEKIDYIYQAIEKKNEEEKYMRLQNPAVVFYTNIKKSEKAENGDRDKKKGGWDAVFVYGKIFNNGHYYKFEDLLSEEYPYKAYVYKNTKTEVFPLKPSETETKNLLYTWICNLVAEAKENLVKEIKDVVSNEIPDGKFGDYFADLDDVDSHNLEVI